jgi:hypothetical protein
MLFAWFVVPVIADRRFEFICPMCWTLQNLKDSESKQKVLHFGSIFGAATVICTTNPILLSVQYTQPIQL